VSSGFALALFIFTPQSSPGKFAAMRIPPGMTWFAGGSTAAMARGIIAAVNEQ
jgi:hypothetical protein